MKKLLITATLFFIANFAMAQQDNAAFKADVLKVIEKSGAAAPMQMVKEDVMQSVPVAKRAEFSKDFDASLPSLFEKIAKIYMETYTHEEVKQMIVFYESPIGKKIASSSGELAAKSGVAGQEWGMELQQVLAKYMQ